MKHSRFLLIGCLAAVMAAGAFIFTGCEDEPSTDIPGMGSYSSDPRVSSGIEVSPAEVEVAAVGQRINFTAIGGKSPFRWSLSNTTGGTITTQPDERQVIYTVNALMPNELSVRDGAGQVGIADITAGGIGALTITPSSYTFTSSSTNDPSDIDGLHVQFSVSGGTPPYGKWSVTSPDMGTIDPNTGLYTTDTSVLIGDNQVVISDSAGTKKTATVTTELK